MVNWSQVLVNSHVCLNSCDLRQQLKLAETRVPRKAKVNQSQINLGANNQGKDILPMVNYLILFTAIVNIIKK